MDELLTGASNAEKEISTIIENLDFLLEKRDLPSGDLAKSYRGNLRDVDAIFKRLLEVQTSSFDSEYSDIQSSPETDQDHFERNEVLKGVLMVLEAHANWTTREVRDTALYLVSDAKSTQTSGRLGIHGKEVEAFLSEGVMKIRLWLSRLRRMSRRFDEMLAFHSKEFATINSMLVTTPFEPRIGDSNVSVEDVCNLNSTESSAAIVTSCADGLGSRWVDSSIQGNQSIRKLCEVQTKLLESMDEMVKLIPESMPAAVLQGAKSAQEPATQPNTTVLEELKTMVGSALRRERNPTISIAFCGTVKSGKSTFLNTLVGRSVLPSDELPETSWPCRVRHSPQTEEPLLDVNPALFNDALSALQKRQFGAKLREYKPPAMGHSSVEDNVNEDEDEQTPPPPPNLENNPTPALIYERLVDLQTNTRENLLRFESEGFVLRTHVEGLEAVHDVLQELNDIVRLCMRLEIPLEMNPEPHLWPILTIEFLSLKNKRLEGIFEFVDLPGIAEQFNKFKFEYLISRLSREFTNIVPVISLKELALPNWELLPEIINNGTGAPPPLVVCTHYDTGADRLDEKVEKVKRVFGSDARGPQIIPCSPKMGFSAQTLLRMSTHKKPVFELLWDESSVQYPCVREILGVGEPELNYGNFTHKNWLQSVMKQLEKSRLLRVFDCVTKDIVPNAQRRLLKSDNEAIWKLLRRISNGLKRELLGTRRSRKDFEDAYNQFVATKIKILDGIEGGSGHSLEDTWREKLRDCSAKMRKECDRLSAKCVDSAVSDLGVRFEIGQDMLVLKNKSAAEAFEKRLSEIFASSVRTVQESYLNRIQDFTKRACNERAMELKKSIEGMRKDGFIQTDDLEELVPGSVAGTEGLTMEKSNDEGHHLLLLALLTLAEFNPGSFIAGTLAFVTVAAWKYFSDVKLKRTDVIQKLDVKVVPFAESLSEKGEEIFGETLKALNDRARTTVANIFAEEEARLENERRKKDAPVGKQVIASTVVSFISFRAAEAAMLRLQEHLASAVVVGELEDSESEVLVPDKLHKEISEPEIVDKLKGVFYQCEHFYRTWLTIFFLQIWEYIVKNSRT